MVSKTGDPDNDDIFAEKYGDEYLGYVIRDGTPESYLEYSLFMEYSYRFYGIGMSNYSSTMLMCDKTDIPVVEKKVEDFYSSEEFPESIKLFKDFIDFTPTISMDGDHVRVRFLTFNEWGGLNENIYTYDDYEHYSNPEIVTNNLIHYDCGIVY
jgi:hypothetical protein